MPTRKKGTKPSKKGPPRDDVVATLANLSRDWRDDAETTLLALQRELRSRAADLDAIELIGAIRAIGETLTTSRALVGGDQKESAPAKPTPPATGTTE